MSKNAIQYRCGMCLHFNQNAHPAKGNGQVCSKLGIKAYNVAPRCFTPDVTKLVENNEDLAALALAFGSLTSQQKTIFVALLQTNRGKRPFPIGQKLYFRAVGGDYLQNYLTGFVMGYTSTRQIILSGSPENKTRGRLFLAYLEEESVMSPTQWKKKRYELIKADRLIDPKKPLTKIKKIDIDYEPPTIDQAPKEWKDSQKARRPRIPRGDETVKDLTIEIHRQDR